MDELTQLAIKYGTDKWGKHNYTPVYHKLFKDRRIASDSRCVAGLLEIGVAEGAGLYMFREYFPVAVIYGLDNDIGRTWAEDRIEVYWGSQALAQDLDALMEKTSWVDIVIDDGSHKTEDQIFTCLYLMPKLDENVTYIIEDVSEPEVVAKALWHYDVQVEKVGARYDDTLVIVRRKGV